MPPTGAGSLPVGSAGTRDSAAPSTESERRPSALLAHPGRSRRGAGTAALLAGSSPTQPSGGGTAQRQPPEPGGGTAEPTRPRSFLPSLPPRARRSRSGASPPHPPAAPFQMGRPWPAAEDGSPGPRPQSVACCAPGGRPAGLEAARRLRAPEDEQEPRGGLELASPRRPMEAARLLLALLLLLLVAPLRLPTAAGDATATPPGSPALPARTPAAQEPPEAFEPARGQSGAGQPVVGISQRVKMRPGEKKDLGTLGYVLGIIMVVVLIGIGVGVVLGYLYKRGKDLKERQEQKANEREMQRITLPLSAFSNPACELVEENVIVVHTSPSPVEEIQGGNTPLMGQAGTPGA
ncbi:phosphoinositide-3-kinase-interacting protein 1 [Ahaetulla prasina]|uniref:phosphoinositide-3-kinase-interacting protein 1 n=1 Tax=Ahaetulla prasina TaxID=499056 RepID=UPI002648C47B|nr:phosphoinositide-3-kinase-interacting protein 1 [Ahaetulla prasina]